MSKINELNAAMQDLADIVTEVVNTNDQDRIGRMIIQIQNLTAALKMNFQYGAVG